MYKHYSITHKYQNQNSICISEQSIDGYCCLSIIIYYIFIIIIFLYLPTKALQTLFRSQSRLYHSVIKQNKTHLGSHLPYFLSMAIVSKLSNPTTPALSAKSRSLASSLPKTTLAFNIRTSSKFASSHLSLRNNGAFAHPLV